MSTKPESKKRKLTADITSSREEHAMKKTLLDESHSASQKPDLSLTNSKPELINPSTSKPTPAEALPPPENKTKRNAFQELMAPKISTAAQSSAAQEPKGPSNLRLPNPNSKEKGFRRDDLGLYTSNSKIIPKELRFYETVDYVAIRDLYPKSTVHTLLLFKTPKNIMHPFHLLEDPELLAKARDEAKRLRQIVGKELQRKFGKFSAQDKRREQVLNGEVTLADNEDLPEGRDWEKEVMVGIHARPSMNHCHIHVLSPDRFSECMKKRNHYQSFSTRFFVNLDEFPLAEDDPRWDSSNTNGYLKEDFTCWRCKTRFSKFPELKRHLDEEFEKWKAE